ncbi:uncharacterized protein BP01DRAFT_213769 [Aspergillus saccharolyticus JOP 1030-1]|uniref:Uncharacterized protein n=1 Tax=Aspergillus saccharolyticus JOP 1030-1 TaxID=1450539 RepID=A0A318ZLN3_9EURO|nr:hypothetical protein BP01DRAFT_213769 [Aspergillus saccharolyticus JOP 1030-1]PYH47344.1 hypothetical protein BP01DRAFT_213769 [Aspergillus saccharolyticus JOP 1030-1]
MKGVRVKEAVRRGRVTQGVICPHRSFSQWFMGFPSSTFLSLPLHLNHNFPSFLSPSCFLSQSRTVTLTSEPFAFLISGHHPLNQLGEKDRGRGSRRNNGNSPRRRPRGETSQRCQASRGLLLISFPLRLENTTLYTHQLPRIGHIRGLLLRS